MYILRFYFYFILSSYLLGNLFLRKVGVMSHDLKFTDM